MKVDQSDVGPHAMIVLDQYIGLFFVLGRKRPINYVASVELLPSIAMIMY